MSDIDSDWTEPRRGLSYRLGLNICNRSCRGSVGIIKNSQKYSCGARYVQDRQAVIEFAVATHLIVICWGTGWWKCPSYGLPFPETGRAPTCRFLSHEARTSMQRCSIFQEGGEDRHTEDADSLPSSLSRIDCSIRPKRDGDSAAVDDTSGAERRSLLPTSSLLSKREKSDESDVSTTAGPD